MQLVQYLAFGLGVIILAYGVGRAVGFGFFKSKLEYFRTLRKEVGGQSNGKE